MSQPPRMLHKGPFVRLLRRYNAAKRSGHILKLHLLRPLCPFFPTALPRCCKRSLPFAGCVFGVSSSGHDRNDSRKLPGREGRDLPFLRRGALLNVRSAFHCSSCMFSILYVQHSVSQRSAMIQCRFQSSRSRLDVPWFDRLRQGLWRLHEISES